MRLDIPAGTAVRFEPGQTRTVRLAPYLGGRESHGFQAKVAGKLGPIAKVGPSNEGPTRISRAAYAHMFGPTDGRPGAARRHRSLHRGREATARSTARR